MSDADRRILVIFVDAFGPGQLERFGELFDSLPHRASLDSILAYSSGALPTILTGQSPSVHGRMCLFSAREHQEPGILDPLRWLGLLPRLVHERGRVRRVAERLLARSAGLTGYVALHRVPPEHFTWLDIPEREDMFTAETVGGASTFLSDARAAGLRVYASPWQSPEPQRWEHALSVLEREAPDLSFLYTAALDGVMHQEGTQGPRAPEVMARIARNIERAREALMQGGHDVTTLVVGDHGMADVHEDVDPRDLLRRLPNMRVFVDSTMMRFWGDNRRLDSARREVERAGISGNWLGEPELAQRRVPPDRYGRSIFLLDEGSIFSPSFLGGHLDGMHGYDLGSASASAALASDRPIPPECRSIASVAGVVRRELGLV